MLGLMETSDTTPIPTECLQNCHFDTGIRSLEGEYGDNEDYCVLTATDNGRGVGLALADGIGSELHGRIVSRMACLAALSELSCGKTAAEAFDAGLQEVRTFLRDADSPKSGAALLVAKCLGGRIDIAFVGDCRVARIRDSRLEWLNDPDRVPGTNRLTSAVGADMVTRPSVVEKGLLEGDTLVFVTDGVFDTITSEAITESVLSAPLSSSAAETLVRRARRTGKDDATAAVIRFH